MLKDTVDGTFTLAKQSDVIANGEQANNMQLVAYAKGQAVTNDASFDEVPLGQDIPPLQLIEVQGDIAAITSAQTDAGRKLVFDNEVFVESEVKRVAGFR